MTPPTPAVMRATPVPRTFTPSRPNLHVVRGAWWDAPGVEHAINSAHCGGREREAHSRKAGLYSPHSGRFLRGNRIVRGCHSELSTVNAPPCRPGQFTASGHGPRTALSTAMDVLGESRKPVTRHPCFPIFRLRCQCDTMGSASILPHQLPEPG